ncbi:hypothetical protein J4E96_07125 [Pengzhenrongella sicca]|uniref:Uncharacterized protein n=1 Tax=Pengzhenrongella sicca TaxID=2819238 RepID=A0A8A4ZHP5_9MICO|nr:hypothetical protein J4E96_07125 [Pengzhenrongella sicca]
MVRRLGAGAAAALVTLGARTALPLREGLIGGPERWNRSNHRGEPVSLLEGPAAAAGLLVGAVLGATTARDAVGAVVATAGGAAFGLVDDLTEDTGARTKGLRGHLGALAHGRVTTGGLKVLGIGATALAAAAIVTPGHGADGSRRHPLSWAADVAASGALIAATANLVNLLDLRPGRAVKAAGLAAAPIALAGGAGAGVAGAVVGAALGAVRADLAERDMLGDGGANALGALLGTAVVLDARRPVRLALLAGAVALTVVSERVSFTQVIARTPGLRELDALGRRPGAYPA